MLAHVLLGSKRPLRGLREEAILTRDAVFTQRNRQEERKGERIKNTEARSKGKNQGWKEKAGDGRGGGGNWEAGIEKKKGSNIIY